MHDTPTVKDRQAIPDASVTARDEVRELASVLCASKYLAMPSSDHHDVQTCDHCLRFVTEKVDALLSAERARTKPVVDWQTLAVRHGDVLDSIANDHEATADALRQRARDAVEVCHLAALDAAPAEEGTTHG